MYYVVLPSRTAVAIRGAACQRQGPCAPWLYLVGATLAVLALRRAVLASRWKSAVDRHSGFVPSPVASSAMIVQVGGAPARTGR